MQVEKAEQYIIQELGARLDPSLYYHGLHHILDVTHVALDLAKLEGIHDDESLKILKTAALYHDSGFMNTYKGHEEEGCRIAREVLPEFGYAGRQIESICGLIMATKIPQNPQNHLERIICDADLDYLGRDDFNAIAETLFRELQERDMVSDVEGWNQVQVRFFETHTYWTQSEQLRRDAQKAMHLARLKTNL